MLRYIWIGIIGSGLTAVSVQAQPTTHKTHNTQNRTTPHTPKPHRGAMPLSGHKVRTKQRNTPRPTKHRQRWIVTQDWSLAQGPYLWEAGTSYGLVGHLVQGRVTVLNTRTWGKIRSKRLGSGQVYVSVKGTWGLVALTSQKKLLLLSLPSLRVHRSYPLSFYPYGVHLEAPPQKSRPSSQPTAPGQPPQTAVVADQIGGRLLQIDLATGKTTRVHLFRWPLRSRWVEKIGILIPLSGPLLLLRRSDWHELYRWKTPGVVGDVALNKTHLAFAYGDGKRSHGTLRLYQLPTKKLRWHAPTNARPRSVTFAGSSLMVLSNTGWLEVFSSQGKRLQRQRLGHSGLAVRCHNANQCTALLPMERKLLLLTRKHP